MGIIEYSKSAFLVFDFSGPEIRIFNPKKKQIAYLLLSLNLFQLIMSIFHAWNNNNLYRFCKYRSSDSELPIVLQPNLNQRKS